MKIKSFICLVLILLTFSLASCGGKEVSSATISRDDEFVGGNLSFVYDEHSRTIYIGGEGEFIQYYDKDLTRNWEEGNRIGFKITAPSEVENLKKTTLEMNGMTFTDMFVKIDGQQQDFFNIYPLVTEDTKEIVFKITWEENIATQTYTIKIVEGTALLDSDNEIQNINQEK